MTIMSNVDIPKDKHYPNDAAQCDECGGFGCPACEDKGWVPPESPHKRKCLRESCDKNIPPGHIAVYCSNECAFLDATLGV